MTLDTLPELTTAVVSSRAVVGISADWQVFRIDPAGGVTTTGSLTRVPVPAESAVPSPDGTKVAVRVPTETGRLQWHTYDVTTDALLGVLDPNIGQLSWSPDSQRILYEYQLSAGTQNFSTAKPDGSDWQALASIPATVEYITWLGAETYAVSVANTPTRSLSQLRLSTKTEERIVEHATQVQENTDGTWLGVVTQDVSSGRREQPALELRPIDASTGISTPSSVVPNLVAPTFAWSNAGSSVYLLEGAEGGRELTLIDAPTGKRTPLRVTARDFSLDDITTLLLGDAGSVLVEAQGRIIQLAVTPK